MPAYPSITFGPRAWISPTPDASGLAILISTLGIAFPTLPALAFTEALATVSTGEASVRPYPSASGIPRAWKNSAVFFGRAAPPLIRYRGPPPSASWMSPKNTRPRLRPAFWPSVRLTSMARSNTFSTAAPRSFTRCSMRRSSICQRAGTPTIAVTRPLVRPSESFSAVSSSRYRIRAPRESGRSMPHVNSKVWWSGSTLSTRSRSVSGKIGASAASSEVKLPCVSITPFGSPVVPLV